MLLGDQAAVGVVVAGGVDVRRRDVPPVAGASTAWSIRSATVFSLLDLVGGKGVLASQGTYTEIKWSKKDGKLSLTTTDGQPLKLNPGRSWIGYASANNGGKVVEK